MCRTSHGRFCGSCFRRLIAALAAAGEIKMAVRARKRTFRIKCQRISKGRDGILCTAADTLVNIDAFFAGSLSPGFHEGLVMDQRFEGQPRAEIRLDGRTVVRSPVANDWGSQLVWEVRRNGEVVSLVSARASDRYEFADAPPGHYEIVLQMFRYEGYQKDKDGNFTQSKFVDVSNKVTSVIN
jgi:hypothetical protein